MKNKHEKIYTIRKIKEKRRVDEIKRRSWLGINPVTRIADTDRKNYKRKSKHPEKYE